MMMMMMILSLRIIRTFNFSAEEYGKIMALIQRYVY